jgi:hypothetical protein
LKGGLLASLVVNTFLARLDRSVGNQQAFTWLAVAPGNLHVQPGASTTQHTNGHVRRCRDLIIAHMLHADFHCLTYAYATFEVCVTACIPSSSVVKRTGMYRKRSKRHRIANNNVEVGARTCSLGGNRCTACRDRRVSGRYIAQRVRETKHVLSSSVDELHEIQSGNIAIPQSTNPDRAFFVMQVCLVLRCASSVPGITHC